MLESDGDSAEARPLASLLLIAFNEIIARPSWVIHALCLLLVAARLAHVHGMSQKNAMGRGRRLGAMMTFAVIVAASILCIASMIMGRV